MFQTFIVSPMELVKTQMQVCGETSISSTCRMIYQSAGMSGKNLQRLYLFRQELGMNFRNKIMTAWRQFP